MRKKLDIEDKDKLLLILEKRFKDNMNRHMDIEWEKVKMRLEKNDEKLWTLNEMETTGGEPDVIGQDDETYIYCDCSKETPIGRRSICYDKEAWESRKKFKPETSAMEMADKMGIEMLNEEEYKYLQTFGVFDTKSSSWIKTPENMRKLGGALFADSRYDRVFFYHNGVESYYQGRGFRGKINV